MKLLPVFLLLASTPLLAWKKIPDDIPLGPANIHLHLASPWRVEQFNGEVPRIVYSIHDPTDMDDSVAEFQVIRTRIPHLDDKSSLAAIADQLVIEGKIKFAELVYDEDIRFARADGFVTKGNGKETYWYVNATNRVLKRVEKSYAKVGVVFTKDLFTSGIVYLITGFETNRSKFDHARYFDTLDKIVDGLKPASQLK